MIIPSEMHAEIESCHYLFLREISEPKENCLRLLVEEAKADPELTSMDIGGVKITDLHRVQPTEDCRAFEILWDQYVAYQVINESFANDDDSERIQSGRLVRAYANSHFLSHLSRVLFANSEYPGPLRHVRVNCENHVIDIVSWVSPQIRRLR